MRVSINVGTRFPAYATSMGRVLLAALPDDELDAYLARAGPPAHPAHDRQRRRRCAIELPASARRAGRWWTRSSRRACARSRPRSATAAAGSSPRSNVSAHASRASARRVRRELLPPLLETAQRIEADLRDVSPGRLRAS